MQRPGGASPPSSSSPRSSSSPPSSPAPSVSGSALGGALGGTTDLANALERLDPDADPDAVVDALGMRANLLDEADEARARANAMRNLGALMAGGQANGRPRTVTRPRPSVMRAGVLQYMVSDGTRLGRRAPHTRTA